MKIFAFDYQTSLSPRYALGDVAGALRPTLPRTQRLKKSKRKRLTRVGLNYRRLALTRESRHKELFTKVRQSEGDEAMYLCG